MENRRLFISLPLEPALTKQLVTKFKKLDLPWEKLKTVDPQHIHITLKFLGDTPIDRIPEIIDVLNLVSSRINYLELNIKGTVIFNKARPQVLSLEIDPNQKLQNLQAAIEEVLYQAGLSNKDMRRFSPHLTMARVKQSADFSEFKNFLDWPLQLSFNASYFELQESELTKQGPEYSVLQTFDL